MSRARAVTAAGVVMLALTACGSDGAPAQAARDPESAHVVSDSAPTQTGPGVERPVAGVEQSGAAVAEADAVDTATPPAYSFDASVPRPEVQNTGADYIAIYSSLRQFRIWLAAHHPDPALLAEAYVEGTAVYERHASDLRILRRNVLREVDVDDALEIEVASALDGVVTLRLTETLTSIQLVEHSGRVVDEQIIEAPLHLIAIITSDANGRWRIASVEPAIGDASNVEVQL